MALAVHIGTASGVDVSSRFPLVWLLHLGALLVFALFVLSARGASGNGLTPHGVIDHLPVWAVLAVAVVVAYALFDALLA